MIDKNQINGDKNQIFQNSGYQNESDNATCHTIVKQKLYEAIEEDNLIFDALKLFIEQNCTSPSLLQRKFEIGFSRACQIVDKLENLGFIEVDKDNGNKKIGITLKQFNDNYGDVERK